MIIFYQPELSEGAFYLAEEESRHCARVLRKQTGDQVTVVDGKGIFYTVKLTTVKERQTSFEIIDQTQESTRKRRVHIAVAPTKNQDRMEWMVEKLVEIGIDEISLIHCHHSERKHIRIDRLEKKAVSAMKQSLKASLPQINPLQKFEYFLDQARKTQQKFIAHLQQDAQHLKETSQLNDNCLLIGPEGDFSKEEIEKALMSGFTPVSLGESRLRTETAALAGCVILNL